MAREPVRGVPAVGGHLLFFPLTGILGGRLFTCRGFVASLLCLCLFCRFDRNLGVIRQAVSASGNYALTLFQPVKNLHVLILPYSDLDCQLASVLIRANDHDGRATVGGSQNRRGGGDQSAGHTFGHHRPPDPRSWLQRAAPLLSLYPGLARGAFWIHRPNRPAPPSPPPPG